MQSLLRSRRPVLSLAVLLAVTLTVALPRVAHAAFNDVWTGAGTTNNWSDAANWSAGVPTGGAAYSIDFPISATSNDDISSLSLGTVQLDANSTVTSSGGASISFATGGGITVTGTNTGVVWQVPFDISGTVNIVDSPSNGGMVFQNPGIISGSGSFIVTGLGQTEFQQANTFSGGITAAGVVELSNDAAAGTGTITVPSGGQVTLMTSSMTIANSWSIVGNGSGVGAVFSNGTDAINGVVTLTGAASWQGNSGDVVTFNGGITGNQPFQMSGAQFILPTNNAISASNVTGSATALLEASGAVGPSGLVIVDSGSEVLLGPGVDVTNPLAISGTGVNGDALSTTGGSATWSGIVSLGADTSIGAGAGSTLTVAGIISGAFNLTIAQPATGTTVLDAANSYTGTTAVTGGTLSVLGTQPQSSVTLSRGLLGGTGSVGAVTATGGTVAPGVAGAPGTLTTAGLSLAAASTFSTVVTGATAGTQYSSLVSTGPVSLGGATLSVVDTTFKPNGVTLDVINNTSGSATAGTFAGLPQGSTLSVDGVTTTVTYAGASTGHDVELTGAVAAVTATPPSAIPVPNTGGAGGFRLGLGLLSLALGLAAISAGLRRGRSRRPG